MMNRKTKLALAALATLFLLVCITFAAILYTLQKSGTWRVNVAYGLTVDGDWDFVANQSDIDTHEFVLTNIGNNQSTIFYALPSNTSLFGFSSDLGNGTTLDAFTGNTTFTITLTDFYMNPLVIYNTTDYGSFDFWIEG